MQGLVLSSMTPSGRCGRYGSEFSWRKQLGLVKRNVSGSMVDVRSFLYHSVWSLSFLGEPSSVRERNMKFRAGWLFKGGEQGLDASSERSESANEDILIFFFQLDLATRVQYALNIEQYDIAQQLRNKLAEVEEEVIKQQEGKKGSSSKSEAQDKALRILRLRADLQNAVDRENYALAVEFRDEISKLEAESLAVSARALAYENAKYAFRLGQKVRHKLFGYRAVVCGMDPLCCESNSWMENARVDKLTRGSNQPFYQVLVDVYDDPNLLVTYVAEENLVAPEKPDKVLIKEHVVMPLISMSFLDPSLQSACRRGLNIPMFPSYFMGWIQLEISFQLSNCVKSIIGLVMKCLWIHKMMMVEKKPEKLLHAALIIG